MPKFYTITAQKYFHDFWRRGGAARAPYPLSSVPYAYDYHRLNGTSSPVLTATCLSYGSL